jgi:hypothetical protein
VVVPYLRRLVAGLSPRRQGFAPRSIHVEFVVDKAALRQVLSKFFGFPCQYHSTVVLHTRISSSAGMNNRPNVSIFINKAYGTHVRET